ncbi:MAG: hypothetical protein VR67_19210 [Peptococcaceae bacterium BRH_c8a]|nr:MAG: hypothetical protein VR67_19210 [Peptococcaceae bacterium BRH_c8a]
MPKKNHESAVEQDFDRLRAEQQAPVEPAAGLAGRDFDVQIKSAVYAPDPELQSDELIAANNKNFDPRQMMISESLTIPPQLLDDVIPKDDTKAGPGLESLRAALSKDVDPLAALNADGER